jgi:hypothetical protein
MPQFALAPAAVIGLLFSFAGLSLVAPQWMRDVGLDFWNNGAEEARLRAGIEESRHREEVREQTQRRIALMNAVATDLCDGHIQFDEAICRLEAMVEHSPDWFTTIRDLYCGSYLPPTSTDRDVLTCYLRIKLEWLHSTAEQRGDVSRAAFIRARLDHFNDETSRQRGP